MAKKNSDAGLVRARVLVDCEAGLCNTLVEAEQAQIDAWAKSQLVDTSPEAVAAVSE